MKSKLEGLLTRKPIAVLISDIHYNINTLEIADKALKMAVDHANDSDLPLMICGDLHDTKANIRGECASAIIETLNVCNMPVYILRGNHDSLHEKSNQTAMTFLSSHAYLYNQIQSLHTMFVGGNLAYAIPYHHDADELRAYLKTLPKNSTLIMHQGVVGTQTGHYFQDKSALNQEDLASFRVISGHYHTRQSFDLPEGGRFDYIGNPFTLGFGEANDPEKGYQILYSDGSLEFIPTNLRKHVVLELTLDDNPNLDRDFKDQDNFGLYLGLNALKVEDPLWIKIKGPSDRLTKYTKQFLTNSFKIRQNFKLDLIPTDVKTEKQDTSQPQDRVLDGLIDSLSDTDLNRKARLKLLWKQLAEGDK